MKDPLNLTSYKQLVRPLQPLTDSEAALNSYIISHFEELPYYGIIDLEKKTKVSKTTIGRYLNKLGYTGYSAFKNAIKRDLTFHNIIAPIEANKAKSNNQDTNTTKAAFSYISNVSQLIDQFAANLNIDALEELANLVSDKNRKVYVVGPASSHALAVHFSTQLKYSRSDVILLPLDKRDLSNALVGMESNDILVAFSYYRFNPVVLDITKYFCSKDAYVTVVTNTHSNPYGIYSNAQYVLPSDVNSILQSRTIGFLFVELLLFLVQRKSHNDNNLEELEHLFKFFGTFSAK